MSAVGSLGGGSQRIYSTGWDETDGKKNRVLQSKGTRREPLNRDRTLKRLPFPLPLLRVGVRATCRKLGTAKTVGEPEDGRKTAHLSQQVKIERKSCARPAGLT